MSDSNYLSDSAASAAMQELSEFSIKCAMNIIEADQELVPFIISKQGKKFYEHGAESGQTEDIIDEGRMLIQSFPSKVSMYALIYLGEIEQDEVVTDAIILEIGQRDEEIAYLLARPVGIVEKDDEEVYSFLDETLIVDETENLLS